MSLKKPAMLPILWSLFPNHRNLLNASFDLTPELVESGHVVKPIVGRCGANIQIIDHNRNTLAHKPGDFEDRA